MGGRWIPRRLYCRWKLSLKWCAVNYGTTKSDVGGAKSGMAKTSALQILLIEVGKKGRGSKFLNFFLRNKTTLVFTGR